MKKYKLKKKNIIIFILLIILLGISIFFILRNLSQNKESIIGTWTTDGITIYEFNSDNTGTLTTSVTTHEFTYTINDNRIFIDFISDKSIDTTYTYTFEDNKLILTSDRGTFIFNKK